ncbi:MAG TPA: HD domain-containing protein [Spirochaetota bacterium]|nr:HD domain-containing protein [Spirochaetota bacterium]
MNGLAKYPTEDECYELIQKFNMLPNIVNHSIQVMRVSLAIYGDLEDPGSLSRELIVAAALLHDIAKTRSIEKRELRHDLIGGEILRELGYEEIADICENHVIYNDFSETTPVNEKDIVFYADKRVMHDRVVDIDTRIADLVERYGKTEKIREMIIHNKKFVLALERKIETGMKNGLDAALKGL